MEKKVIQTAGRDILGDFAPEFAHYNDDVLFGENWNNKDIDLKTRSIVTVVALMSSGMTDASLKYHLENAKRNGVAKKEIAAILTHTSFYAGWPKGWAAFRLAAEVWKEDEAGESTKTAHEAAMVFPIGEPNVAYAQYFTGQSYLAPIVTKGLGIYNVTFEPSCRNNWHIHHAEEGGGQILICVGGRGYYQEWGKEAVKLEAGDSVTIPAGIKHWHGAQRDAWFSHLAIEVPGANASNEWLEEVDDRYYESIEA